MQNTCNDKVVLVTGATGDIGTWLVDFFLKRNYFVIALSRTSTSKYNSSKGVKPLDVDITNYLELRQSLANTSFKFCVHAASLNKKYDVNSFNTNVIGTYNLLRFFDENSISVKLVYLSTFQVYGKYLGKINELTKVRCTDDYSTTHICAENLILKNIYSNKLNGIILRLSNTYGFPEFTKSWQSKSFISEICRQVVEDKSINLTSEKEEFRDYIHLLDLCYLIEKIIKNNKIIGTFNVSSNVTYTNLDIGKMAQDIFFRLYKKSIKLNTRMLKMKKNNQLTIDNSKIRKKISDFNFPDRVEETIVKTFMSQLG